MMAANDDNQSAYSHHAIDAEKQHVREPLVVDPGLSETRERERVGMKEAVVLENQLSGAQMPPGIRVRHTASSHGKETESEDGDEYMTSLQKADHASRQTRL